MKIPLQTLPQNLLPQHAAGRRRSRPTPAQPRTSALALGLLAAGLLLTSWPAWRAGSPGPLPLAQAQQPAAPPAGPPEQPPAPAGGASPALPLPGAPPLEALPPAEGQPATAEPPAPAALPPAEGQPATAEPPAPAEDPPAGLPALAEALPAAEPQPIPWGQDYLEWGAPASGFYFSPSHNNRLTRVYVYPPQARKIYVHNAQAIRYLRFEQLRPYPPGSTIVQETWAWQPEYTRQQPRPGERGPFFMLQKQEAGYDEAGGNWRYGFATPAFIQLGDGSENEVQFCKTCHARAKSRDFIYANAR